MKKYLLCTGILFSPISFGNQVQDPLFSINTLVDGGDLSLSSATIPWSFEGGINSPEAKILNPTSSDYSSEGNIGNVLVIQDGDVVQQLPVSLQFGTTYTVSADVGYSNSAMFSGYSISFRVGTSVIPLVSGATASQGQFQTVNAAFLADANYQSLIDSGLPLELVLSSSDLPAVSEAHFDNISVVLSSDADNDGMTDDWELQYGFDPSNALDANEDFDLDGSTNLEEFVANTDPTNSANFPAPLLQTIVNNTQVEGALRLVPQATPPVICDISTEGAMYYDDLLNLILICDGTGWNEFKGPQGETGPQGEQGPQGATGPQGVDGPIGLTGIQGPQGETGPQGIQGETGPQGIQGEPGTIHWTDGTNVVHTSVQVGVGTNTPGAALEVVGNAIANDPVAANHLVTLGHLNNYVDTADGNLQSQINQLNNLVASLTSELSSLRATVFSDQGTNCQDILTNNPSAQSGIYNVDPDGNGGLPAFSAYCDMDSDGGGWTLVGTYPRTEPGGKGRISDYPGTPDTNPNSPTNLGLFQGSLASFQDAKEQVSCTDSGCRNAYATNLNTTQLQTIRYTWGVLDRHEHIRDAGLTIPDCTSTYGTPENVSSCWTPSTNPVEATTVNGWQLDLDGTTYCFVARGYHFSDRQGSPTCQHLGEPNGTRWALLWFR